MRLGDITSTLRSWSVIPLRVIVGYGFMAHGYAKVINGPDHFAAALHALGVPAPQLMAWVTIGFELLGGLAILIGAWIPLVSVPLAAILLVAAITVHLPYGFSSIKLRAVTAAGPQFGPPGYETNLLYLAALITLVAGGAGPLAVDALLARKGRRERAQRSEPRERTGPSKRLATLRQAQGRPELRRRARERVGESEGRSPSVK